MNYIETHENAIKTKLESLNLSGVDVVVVPEKQAEYERPFINGKITIAYAGSEFEGPDATDISMHYEKITIGLAIQSKALRGNTGIYGIVNACRKHLTGFRPDGFWQMAPKKIDLKSADYNNNLWTYYFEFETKMEVVEVQIDPDDPILTEIDFNINP